jgi:hypothetical protein
MAKAPTRFKDREDYDVGETLATIQAEHANEPAPQFETDTYREHRADVLREGGLDEEADESTDDPIGDLEQMTPADHFARMARERAERGRH